MGSRQAAWMQAKRQERRALGLCVECGSPAPMSKLKAMPGRHARRCAECAAKRSRRRSVVQSPPED